MPTYKYKSDNTSVATVSDSGRVTAVSQGNANIKVSTEGGVDIASVPVTVRPRESDTRPSGITLDKSSVTINTAGVRALIKATISPETTVNKTVKWSVSDSSIISVHPRGNNTCEIWDEEGQHWGESSGTKTATVYAKTADGQQASCEVIVNIRGTIIDSIEVLDATVSGGVINVPYSANTFRIKCNYHNIDNCYGGIEVLGEDGIGSSGGRVQENGYTIIPINVKENYYCGRTLSFKVRGNGAGDSWTSFTVRQAGGQDVYSIGDSVAYFDKDGEAYHPIVDGSVTSSYAQTLMYYCNPEISKSIISRVTMPNWISFDTSRWYCYKRTGGRISTMSSSEWNSFINNPPADTLAECSIPLSVQPTTVARDGEIVFPGGDKIIVHQDLSNY